MDEDDLEARKASTESGTKKKKKKKKKPVTEGDDGGGGGGEPRKKKKKKKPKTTDDVNEGNDIEDKISSKIAAEDGSAPKKKKKKKKKPKVDEGEGAATYTAPAAAAAVAGGAAAAAAPASAMDEKFGYGNDDGDGEYGNSYGGAYDGGDVEMTQVEKDKYNEAGGGGDAAQLDQDGNNVTGGGYGAYGDGEKAYNFEADTEIMAEINQEGVVQVDESGGIQAFVAETIAIDGDAVGIIRSDAEIEKEEKRRYTKYFCGAVAVLVVIIVAIAVPVTLSLTKKQKTLKVIVTNEPTDVPSMMPSEVPSQQPSSERFMDIVAMLKPLSGEALRKPGTPQYLAAMWMADDDPIPNLASPTGRGLDLDDPGFEQRYAMAVFYYAMDGNNWESNNGWLGEESVCKWFGVEGSSAECLEGCIKRTDYVGSFDKVCRIAMGKTNNLYGEIPSEMKVLEEMRWFEVQDAYIIGTIPDSIGTAWTKVHTILLGSNFISGGFPETFANNEMLGTIFLDHNRLNTTFPNVFTTLKNLEWLDLQNNQLNGPLPDSISDLKSMRIFDVTNNSLTGYLPDSWDETNLIEDLELGNNTFKGRLPPSLSKTKFIKDLRLSGNELTGEIPLGYYKLGSLEELYLDENQMGGKLPDGDEPFYDGLQEFSIHDNNFEGRFPVEHFEDTFRLKVLSLHNNQLTGFISTNICERMDDARAYTQLLVLTADCQKLTCECDGCVCSEDGEIFFDQDGKVYQNTDN